MIEDLIILVATFFDSVAYLIINFTNYKWNIYNNMYIDSLKFYNNYGKNVVHDDFICFNLTCNNFENRLSYKMTIPKYLHSLCLNYNIFIMDMNFEIEKTFLPESLHTLSISYHNMSDLKEDIFPNSLHTLILINNTINKIKKKVFPKGLHTLILKHNRIEKIEEKGFPEGLNTLILYWNTPEIGEKFLPKGLYTLNLNDNDYFFE